MPASQISLCMIVKDEEQFLEECLNSVKDLVSEIIIVDTGSTDNTKNIAKKFTDKIFDFKWADDFSAARNFAISKATKDWILFLDADEAIAKEDHKKIKGLIEKAGNEIDVFGFLEKSYTNNSFTISWMNTGENDKHAKGFAGYYLNPIFRLFKNKKGVKFDGKVHETIIGSVEKAKLKALPTSIPIHHYKELRESKKEKKESYLKLVEEKLKKDPGNTQALFEAGQMCLDAGELEKAAGYFEKTLKSSHNYDVMVLLGIAYERLGKKEKAENIFKHAIRHNPDTESAYIQLSTLYIKNNDSKKAIEILETLIKRKSKNIIVCNNLGVAYLNSSKIQEAVTVLRQGIAMDRKSRTPVSVMIHNNFFDALLRLGKREEAEKMLKEAVSFNPNVKSYYQNLAVYYRKAKQEEKAKDILSKGKKLFPGLK